ncbi:MAG: DsbA family protein [Saprospiraceae bacterium]|nr:DsbA family protein [Saprospiraceae bacterium]MCZ2340070.1 DsbA family protein [Chitinophagales bacterium]
MRTMLVLILTTLATYSMRAQENAIIYVGDPMCSWCYGFAPELDKVKAAFPNTHFEMIMGGLRAHGTETMGDLKDFLKEHWMEIAQLTAQPFKYDILDQSELVYDTEPACRAVMVVGQLKPESMYEYFKAVQRSFYAQNRLPQADTYAQLATQFGIAASDFMEAFDSDDSKDAIDEAFNRAEILGVRGFPTLMARIDGNMYMISNGFLKADKIIKLLKDLGMN